METPTKETLIIDLENITDQIINWYHEQPEDQFNKEFIAEKWTMAGHLYHLIKTTKGVSKGMAMPRLALRTAFGKSNRAERTFDQQYKKYKDTLTNIAATTGKGVVPPGKFIPEPGRAFEKEALIKRFSHEIAAMKTQIEKWKEKDMGVYVLPHPAMGKMTIREFIYFTIFHTQHHLDNLAENYVVK